MSSDNGVGSAPLPERAEDKLAKRGGGAEPRREEELRTLVHELEVHQIELELQNEELRQARSQLEANYNELYDFAPIGYFTLARNGEVVKANLTGAEMLGRSRSQLLGRRLAHFMAGESRAQFADFLQRVFGAEGKRSCIVTLTKDNGTPVAAFIEASAAGAGSSCRAVAVDVSSTEQDKLQLRESEHRLKLALAASGMGVWEWNQESGEIYWSPECFKIFGLDSFCPTLADVAALVHPEDRARVAAEAKRALKDRKVHTAEYRIIRRNGEAAWISSVCQARYEASGKPLRLVGTAQDVTERKQAGKDAAK
ncbi:MAG: PAS domain-containing protein [Betaproteobacteria bacterium]|nr:PAS domain-containing protein [Betaproteobacteria bacterium]